jgi:hypothetical protein
MIFIHDSGSQVERIFMNKLGGNKSRGTGTIRLVIWAGLSLAENG